MRKKIIIIIVVMLILLGCTMLIVKNNDNEKGEMLSIPVNNNELLVCSEEGFNSIKVYRKENQMVRGISQRRRSLIFLLIVCLQKM